jgi:hypothetical protein
MDADKELSYQQIRWFKGVLLPALAKDTGDSVTWWESELKLKILPDEFEPVVVVLDDGKHWVTPSIKTLSMEKMNFLITESVAYLRDESQLKQYKRVKKFGNNFQWVYLPDKLKKKS